MGKARRRVEPKPSRSWVKFVTREKDKIEELIEVLIE